MYPHELSPATAVGYWVQVGGVDVFHVGLVTDRQCQAGAPYVISASKRTGRVAEETWEEFSQGAPVSTYDVRGDLPPHHVLERARARDGHEWHLFLANCEHFVRWAHGLPEESPQLQQGVAKAGLVVAGTALAVGVVAVIAEALSAPKRRRYR